MALRALLRSQDLLSCSALQLSDRAIARLPTATILLRACQTLLHSHQGTDSLRPAHCSMAHSQARQLSSSSASGSTESPAGPVKVAVGQMTAVGDQERNFEVVSHLCQDASQQACVMLFLPECFAFIGLNQKETVAAMQPLDGPLMQRYCRLAAQHQLWLSLGGFQETGPDPEHLYNCHVVVTSEGKIAARYRKVHLFNVEVQNGPVLMESRSTAPGNELVVCDSPAGRLGLTVCYDLRFPEVYQRLVFDMGAQVLLVPSAFTKLTGRAHWELLLRARAVETQCFVIAAAQAGVHNEKRESFGDSIIIDPWGDVIGKLDDPLATGIAVAELDFDKMRKVRERMPMADHRRQGRISLGWDAPHDELEAVFAPGGSQPQRA